MLLTFCFTGFADDTAFPASKEGTVSAIRPGRIVIRSCLLDLRG